MPENLSTILESTEPTLLTTDWGRTEWPLWHASVTRSLVVSSSAWGRGATRVEAARRVRSPQ